MKKCLYFICPTDSLELIIESTFHHENYFYSSLGNSLSFTQNELNQFKKLIFKKRIREITFILSDNNRIVSDALGKQDFSNVTGLHKFYNKFIEQKENLEMSWQTLNPQFLMLSYFLNNKIKELKIGLGEIISDRLVISGKIHNRKEDMFNDIYSDLICTDHSILN